MRDTRSLRPSDVGFNLRFPMYKVGDVISIPETPWSRAVSYKVLDVTLRIAEIEIKQFTCECGAHERAFEDGAYPTYDYDYDEWDAEEDDYYRNSVQDASDVEPEREIYLPYCTCNDRPRIAQYQEVQVVDIIDNNVRYMNSWDVTGMVCRSGYGLPQYMIKAGHTYTAYTRVGIIDVEVIKLNGVSCTVKFVNELGQDVYTELDLKSIIRPSGGTNVIKRKSEV